MPGERIRGIKNISLSDEILHDHFPDYPVMPGALILEASAQLAGFLLETSFHRPPDPPPRALLVLVERAKFHDTAGPGDQLEIRVQMASRMEAAAQVTAEVSALDRRIARVMMTFAMKRIESERLHAQRRYVYELWTRDLDPPVTIP